MFLITFLHSLKARVRIYGPWTFKFYIFVSKDSFSLLFIDSKQGSEFWTPGLVNLKLTFQREIFNCFHSLKARVRISDP